MPVDLRAAVNRDDVLSTLRDIASRLRDVDNSREPVHGCVNAYLEWDAQAEQALRPLISDVGSVLGSRSMRARLRAKAATPSASDIDSLNKEVNRQIHQRAVVLDKAIEDLEAQCSRWPLGTIYAVADTSFYVEHDEKLRDLDFASLLPGAWPDKPIKIVVPIIVLDELDGLKQRGGSAHAKWRASYTLAVLDDILSAEPAEQGILRQPAADGTRGAVIMEVLFDPLRHERLPINDDEIIDRALEAQRLARAPVTLLTFDTSQAARARHAGMAVNKLTKPLGDEPEDTRGKKACQPQQARRPGDIPQAGLARRGRHRHRQPNVGLAGGADPPRLDTT